jgi:hypothetical protein
MLTRPQSRPLLVGAVFLFFVTDGLLWLEGYVPDQYVNALQVSGQLDHGRGGRSGPQMDSVLNDNLLIFGGLVILLAPMALALVDTGPGGTGWKLLTFLCCACAAWWFFFASGSLIPLVDWLLAWASAMAMRMMKLNRFHHQT